MVIFGSYLAISGKQYNVSTLPMTLSDLDVDKNIQIMLPLFINSLNFVFPTIACQWRSVGKIQLQDCDNSDNN